MLICSLAMVWTASHTQALTLPARSPPTQPLIVLHLFGHGKSLVILEGASLLDFYKHGWLNVAVS